jgi:hypothetical protein
MFWALPRARTAAAKTLTATSSAGVQAVVAMEICIINLTILKSITMKVQVLVMAPPMGQTILLI